MAKAKDVIWDCIWWRSDILVMCLGVPGVLGLKRRASSKRVQSSQCWVSLWTKKVAVMEEVVLVGRSEGVYTFRVSWF
jgi:hypothetical protein